MAQPRTIRTLLALVVCMTLGTLALVAMQTDPIRTPILELAAVTRGEDTLDRVVETTDLPVQADKWNNIIVHFATVPRVDIPANFHFIITAQPDGTAKVEATDLWRQQKAGRHTISPGSTDWNADSIGVYITPSKPNTTNFTEGQNRISGELCAKLQRLCGIGNDHVLDRENLP